jgi:hypothetical protein|tara:strand:+ start:227 stop:499 length:273 start_codon:yes stop_codon:yes gene_type:complete
MNETFDIESEIATLSTLISQARELVATNHSIDLSEFTAKIEGFCEYVAANPPEDPEAISTNIEALLNDLNALAQELTDQQTGISAQLAED